MCYYVASKLSGEEIYQLEHDFVVNWEESEYEGYYAVSGFAHPRLPVITADKHFKLMTWGLIPVWVKDWSAATQLRIQTLNAQSETVDSKPSFRTAVKNSRFCIIPINGFFEWHTHENKNKYPFFIYPKQDKLFYAAGLHEQWTNPADGQQHETFTMLTTPANERMSYIHNTKKRMPAFLGLDAAKTWLDKDIAWAVKKTLLQPMSADLILDHTISKLITSRKENPNQAAVVDQFSYPELNADFQSTLFED